MVFKVIFDGESIVCSSPRRILTLLSQGWRLADPQQTEDLIKALEAEELAGRGERASAPAHLAIGGRREGC
jgi:hypothetical protein